MLFVVASYSILFVSGYEDVNIHSVSGYEVVVCHDS